LCELARTNERYRAFWGVTEPLQPKRRRISKTKPKIPINELIAKKRRCQKRKAEGLPCTEFADAKDLPTVIVPPPPPLNLTPSNKIAVVTVGAGEEAGELLRVTETYMRAYAARHGADFVRLTWPGHPSWPMSCKFAVARALDYYERIAYVDADVLLRPGCVNLFEACAPDEFGACDELPWHRLYHKFGRERGYQEFRAKMGFPKVAHLPWMVNCGVMVVPRSHRELLMPPATPIPIHHCAEQDHTNARLLASGLPLRLIDRRCNWQNWTDHDFLAAPKDAILHWSGASRRRARAQEILALAPPLPPIFGIGMEKTGTHSLAKMLRLEHQPDEVAAGWAAVANRGKAEIVARKSAAGDVSNLNVHFIPELLARFPEARFVLTVREPLSWLRSSLHHCPDEKQAEHWIALDRMRKGYGSLAERLRYWEWHNRTVLQNVPAKQLLIVFTDRLDESAGALARFCYRDVMPAREFVGQCRQDDALAGVQIDVEAMCPTWRALCKWSAQPFALDDGGILGVEKPSGVDALNGNGLADRLLVVHDAQDFR